MLNSSSADTPISAAFSSASCLMNLQAKAVFRCMWVLSHSREAGRQAGDHTRGVDVLSMLTNSHDHLADGLGHLHAK